MHDDITKINHKRYSDLNNNNDTNFDKIKYLKFLVTRIFISLILVISASIFVKVNDYNKSYINKYLFDSNLEFTKINNLYQSYIGKIIPSPKQKDEMVFNSDLSKCEYEKYYDGVKIKLTENSPISVLAGGIVVFIGEKDDYGNTVILQGNDGYDYWYGNIKNISINLYDYIDNNTLIGEANNDFIYLVLKKDNKFVSYEEKFK